MAASLTLDSTGGVDYDTDEFVGTAYRLVDIVDEGSHVLTVGAADGEAFAVAIGGDPRDGVGLLRGGALVALIVGLIGGGILLCSGVAAPPPAAEPGPWQPSGTDGPGWPTGPPGFPVPPPTTGAVGPAGPPWLAPPTSAQPGRQHAGAADVTALAPPTSPWSPPFGG